MNEIRNALNAGKEVITHTDKVSVPGWSGAGYIITDPDTGAGAYKIAGGGNGGWQKLGAFVGILAVSGVAFIGLISAIAIASAATTILGFLAAVVLAGWELYNFFDFFDDLKDIKDHKEFNKLLAITLIAELLPLGWIPAGAGAEGAALLIYLEAFLFIFGETWFG